MLQQVFENKVKELRLQQGLSQDELAFYCGMDRPQITKIEQGKVNVTLETIERLSQALQIKTSLLLEETKTLRPFVKWAGGKTQLLDKLHAYMPNEFNNYFEPFIGGGSKLNETARSYKTLALEAKDIPNFTFVWFTDGTGWNSAKHNLEETFDVLDTIYNLNDLEKSFTALL